MLVLNDPPTGFFPIYLAIVLASAVAVHELFMKNKNIQAGPQRVFPPVQQLTGARAKAWSLLTHAEVSLSHGGQDESLEPPDTHGRVSLLSFTLVSWYLSRMVPETTGSFST